MRLSVIPAAALLAWGLSERSGVAESPFHGTNELKVLVFGASWSHGIIEDFPAIAAAAGKKVEVRCLRAAGFRDYWKAIEAAETNAESEAGWVALETDYKAKVRVKEELLSKPWDVIALQRHSLSDKDPELAVATAKKVCDYLRRLAPQAKLAVYQTHAYRGDGEVLAQAKPKGWERAGFTEADSHEVTKSICTRVARENNILLIPVGDAFERVRQDPVHGWVCPDPDFNYSNPERKGVPRQESNSLMIGFKWLPAGQSGKDGRLYKVDDHPNNLGRYLYGLIFFEALFGETVVGNTFRPKGPTVENALKGSDLDTRADKTVSEEKIRFLQQVAHEVLHPVP